MIRYRKSAATNYLIGDADSVGYGQGGYGEGPYGGNPANVQSYDNETLSIYSNVFEHRVIQIHNELKERRLVDEQLETEYANPKNTYSIRAIAERLTALAKKLPG